jgi:hypothetical protein
MFPQKPPESACARAAPINPYKLHRRLINPSLSTPTQKNQSFNMKNSLFFIALLFASFSVFNACKKSDDAQIEAQDQMTSEDIASNEDIAEQNDLDADLVLEERGGGGGKCVVVTFAKPEGTWPNTLTLDFGDGCKRPDGRTLKGKIIINQTAEIRTPGAVRTVTHENFYVDGVKVEGTRSWTNNGKDAAGNWSYTKTATNMKLTFADGTSTTWNKTRTSVLIEGGGTKTHLDDVWSSTGTASGTNRQGNAFGATIVEPLIKKATCPWVSKGQIDFARGERESSLDFGNGTCDRFGKFTNNAGETFVIRLRR